MAEFDRKEFAEMCGVSPSYLNNYIKRGKVKLTGNKIDTAFPENKEFLEKRIKPSDAPAAESHHPGPAKKIKGTGEPVSRQTSLEFSTRKRDAEIKKAEADAQLAELKAAKLMGEYIPLTNAQNVISQMSQSFLTAYRDLSENLVIKIAHEAKLNQAKTAKLRGEIISGMNMAMDNAVENAKKDLNRMADELSEQKQMRVR